MTEPRKPIFGFLWPRPDPHAPLDGAYRQVRLVRVAARGPIRLAVLILGAIITTMTTGTVVMATLTTSFSVASVLGAAICASAIFLLLRGWVVGTFVTDQGVTVDSTWRRETRAGRRCMGATVPTISTVGQRRGLRSPLLQRLRRSGYS